MFRPLDVMLCCGRTCSLVGVTNDYIRVTNKPTKTLICSDFATLLLEGRCPTMTLQARAG
jgi:hypothetical protein